MLYKMKNDGIYYMYMYIFVLLTRILDFFGLNSSYLVIFVNTTELSLLLFILINFTDI